MNFNWESNKRVVGTTAAILTVVTATLLSNIETGAAVVIVGVTTITAAAVLVHLTRPVAVTTSQAIHEARR